MKIIAVQHLTDIRLENDNGCVFLSLYGKGDLCDQFCKIMFHLTRKGPEKFPEIHILQLHQGGSNSLIYDIVSGNLNVPKWSIIPCSLIKARNQIAMFIYKNKIHINPEMQLRPTPFHITPNNLDRLSFYPRHIQRPSTGEASA